MTGSFNDLSALFLNCSLKRSSEHSHTQSLMDVAQTIMDRNGVSTRSVRLADLDIAPRVYPDMTEHGWERDEWPGIQEQVMAADILVIGTPIWLGRRD